MEERYKKFIQHCLDSNDVDGICNFEDYKKIDEQLRKDGFR